jgi:hypothetical protein
MFFFMTEEPDVERIDAGVTEWLGISLTPIKINFSIVDLKLEKSWWFF